MKTSKMQRYAKIASIPVLALVFYGVLPRDKNIATNNKTSSPSDKVENRSASHAKFATAEKTMTKKPEWPVYRALDIASTDPFDKTMIFPESVVHLDGKEPSDSSTQKLISSSMTTQTVKVADVKIQAIFRSPKGFAALVDTRLIQVGDRLSDGAEVIEITPDHLIVAVPNMD